MENKDPNTGEEKPITQVPAVEPAGAPRASQYEDVTVRQPAPTLQQNNVQASQTIITPGQTPPMQNPVQGTPSVYPSPAPTDMGGKIDIAPTKGVADGIPKKHILRTVFICLGILILLVVIAFGILFTTQPNFKNTVLGKNYRNYTYANSNLVFSLNFYKGSKVQKNTYIPNDTNMTIVSPSPPNNGLPIFLEISRDTSVTNAVLPSVKNCTYKGLAPGFIQYVDVAKGNVDFCEVNETGVNALVYIGEYSNGSAVYSIVMAQAYNSLEVKTNPTYDRYVIGQLGLQPYQKDLKQFVGSIKAVN